MTLQVLRSTKEINDARVQLRRRGLSFATPDWKAWLLRHRLLTGTRIGDCVKSWDVAKTAELIEKRLSKNAPVLDIGAYASEVPLVLRHLGYRCLTGLDLNPNIAKMPFAREIDYRVGDFMRTPFPDRSFAAITAISVIEHGFDGCALAAEVARLLKPGGFFIASFDYWPEKIATDGVMMFEMSWTIFSRRDAETFIAVAQEQGLAPIGPLDFRAIERPISCLGRDYTFAWLALEKR
jgi:SAM-dependent methyltransferase